MYFCYAVPTKWVELLYRSAEWGHVLTTWFMGKVRLKKKCFWFHLSYLLLPTFLLIPIIKVKTRWIREINEILIKALFLPSPIWLSFWFWWVDFQGNFLCSFDLFVEIFQDGQAIQLIDGFMFVNLVDPNSQSRDQRPDAIEQVFRTGCVITKGLIMNNWVWRQWRIRNHTC